MWPSWKENKPFSLGLIVLISFLCIFVWAKTEQAVRQTAQIGRPEPMEHLFSVDGEAKVSSAPTIATVSFGVQTKGETVAAAQTENTKTTNALLSAVRAMSVAEADIQTSGYSSYPNTVWNPDKQTSEQDGWIVSQDVTVKVRDVSKVPALLLALGQNGATNISGPNFAVDDQAAMKDAAREKAIADAEAKAAALAKSLGVRFQRVVGYSEYMDAPGPMPFYAAKDMAASAGAPPDIAEGSVELTLHVNLVYKLVE